MPIARRWWVYENREVYVQLQELAEFWRTMVLFPDQYLLHFPRLRYYFLYIVHRPSSLSSAYFRKRERNLNTSSILNSVPSTPVWCDGRGIESRKPRLCSVLGHTTNRLRLLLDVSPSYLVAKLVQTVQFHRITTRNSTMLLYFI